MAEGIQIFNDSGILTIDSTYQNLALVSTGSVWCNTFHLGCKTGDVSITGKNPILGFQSTLGVTIIVRSKVGNTFTFRVYVDTQNDVSINYWVYDSQDDPSPTNFGLQIFNPSGQLCFDAARKYLRVLQYFNSGTGNTYPGKNVVAIPCCFSYAVVWTPSPNLLFWTYNVYITFVKVTSSNQVEMYSQLKYFGSGFSSPGQPYSSRFSVIVSDITNY